MSKELQRYLLTRFGQFLLIIFVAVSINFIIPRLLPGDPVQTALARLQAGGGNQAMDIQAISAVYREKYGLDAPLWEQYINYWADLFRLDLGVSFVNFPENVSTMIGNALPWSIGLLATATLIAFVTGSLLGARLAWPTAGRGIKVMVPMTMPTTAQARPTGSACRAPSANAVRQALKVSGPPRTKRLAITSTVTSARITKIPTTRKLAARRPRPTQNTKRIT